MKQTTIVGVVAAAILSLLSAATTAATPTSCAPSDAYGVWSISGTTQNGTAFSGFATFTTTGLLYSGWVVFQKLNGQQLQGTLTSGSLTLTALDCMYELSILTDGGTSLVGNVALSASREIASGIYTATQGKRKYQGIVNLVHMPL